MVKFGRDKGFVFFITEEWILLCWRDKGSFDFERFPIEHLYWLKSTKRRIFGNYERKSWEINFIQFTKNNQKLTISLIFEGFPLINIFLPKQESWMISMRIERMLIHKTKPISKLHHLQASKPTQCLLKGLPKDRNNASNISLKNAENKEQPAFC